VVVSPEELVNTSPNCQCKWRQEIASSRQGVAMGNFKPLAFVYSQAAVDRRAGIKRLRARMLPLEPK
jgi:hypothetical protein